MSKNNVKIHILEVPDFYASLEEYLLSYYIFEFIAACV